jgi:hypothetical protein
MTQDEIQHDAADDFDEYAEDDDEEIEDYTYFCTSCGHEQFEGEVCEVCGGDDWEFVRLDEEGLRRQAEARGEEWDETAIRRRAAQAERVPLLTPELEDALDGILEDLVIGMYGGGATTDADAPEADAATEADPEAADTVEADETAGNTADDDVEPDEERSPRGKRLGAEETLREWMETNREWLVQEVLRTAPVTAGGSDRGEEASSEDE